MSKFLVALLPASAMAAGGTFSYDPEKEFNPASWAAIPMAGNECGGSAQSGIDIARTGCSKYADYVFSAGSCTLDDIKFTLSDHAIYGHYPSDGSCQAPRMNIPGEQLPFDAVQFHIHTGTDHAIDGVYWGADLHIVHAEQGGSRYGVLGFFLKPDDPSGLPKFRDMLEEWEAVEAEVNNQCAPTVAPPTNATDTAAAQGGGRRLTGDRQLPRSLNMYEFIHEDATMYTYDGSLTTPPCTEIVYWNVVDTPVSLSIREYLRLTNLILDYRNPETCDYASVAAPSGFTGRPVQNINGRQITRVCPTSFQPESERKLQEAAAPKSFLRSIFG